MLKHTVSLILLLLTLTIGAADAKDHRIQPQYNGNYFSPLLTSIHRIPDRGIRRGKGIHKRLLHHHHKYFVAARRAGSEQAIRPSTNAGIVTVQSAAGPIQVAPDFAAAIQGFIQDVVDKGFRGPVHCFATSGHVSNSNHYTGHACDFAQSGWNKTDPVMYHVGEIAARWGLRDGCSFRRSDCGHVDTGQNVRWHASTKGVPKTLKGYMQEHDL